MKKIIAVALVLVAVLAGCTKTGDKKKVINIGISQIVEYVALDQNRQGFIKALEDNGYKDGENIKIDYQNAQGDIGIAQTIAKKFASDKKDLIFAIGTPAAQGAYNATKNIPIMISSVTDPVKAELVKSLNKPETNVSGTSDYLSIEKQLELIKTFVPNAKKIGFLYNTSEVNSEAQLIELKKAAKGCEIISKGVTSTNDVNSAITSLVKDIDVLYVPTDNLVVSSMPIITKTTLKAKVPVIAAEKGSVEAGALATVGIDFYKLGYETGKMAISVLKGEDISKMPVKTSNEAKIYINEDSLKALNIQKPTMSNVEYVKTK